MSFITMLRGGVPRSYIGAYQQWIPRDATASLFTQTAVSPRQFQRRVSASPDFFQSSLATHLLTTHPPSLSALCIPATQHTY